MRRPWVKSAWWGRLGKEYFYCPEDEAAVIVIVSDGARDRYVGVVVLIVSSMLVSSGALRAGRRRWNRGRKEVEGDGPGRGKVNDDGWRRGGRRSSRDKFGLGVTFFLAGA